MSEPAILTTGAGSYPVPAWLQAMPSTPALRDALSLATDFERVRQLTNGTLKFTVTSPYMLARRDQYLG